MTAQITTLIDKSDSSELVRDMIASILLVESTNQQELATLADPAKDPRLWALRVFTERSNPWDQFQNGGAQLEQPPIVNVSFESSNTNKSASDTVERQRMVGLFNIDCYGYGVSAEKSGPGHIPGDAASSLEVQRAMRLVRNILMASAYTYLGCPRGANQFVAGRWPQSITMFQPGMDGHTVQHVMGARLVLQVEFNEFSPQYVAQLLTVIGVTITRAETGEVYLQAQYGEDEP